MGMRARAYLVIVSAVFLAACSASPSSPPSSASALSLGETSTFSVPGVSVPGTPTRYDKVMVRRFGSPAAANVLVLVPGTLAGAADFDIVGPYLAAHVPNLQVWAEMRREGALEDNSMLLRALNGTATVQQAFNYYLGWIADSSITSHYQPLKASQFQFADQWGLAVAMGDLHNVIELARDGGKHTVILGGHSLGGAEASIYPVWDFDGRGGYRDLAGIVGIDGDAGLASGFGGTPTTSAPEAKAALAKLQAGSPWLDLLGFGLPWITGPFAELGAVAALKEPQAVSVNQKFPLLPAELKPSFPATNQGLLGYAFDASTSPAALALIHVHSGHLAARGSPRPWVDAGPTPVQDIAYVFSQEPLGPVDWYFPQRLSIDVGAASSLAQTPAAGVLGLRLAHLHQVDVPMYVIQTSLGGSHNGVADAAHSYQRQSRIPSLTVIDKHSTYSHLDPLLATPSKNAFLQTVVPWIEKLPRYRH
ncbi:MAG TPA: hypothetical protein VK215_14790 [Acidimicrobiales bacterium]|nr:hypothetical protein [Acidimicrobiales bacterium]